MIEMRVVLHKNRINPEIQYRYMKFVIGPPSGCFCPDYGNVMWSEWKTAEWVKAEEIENE